MFVDATRTASPSAVADALLGAVLLAALAVLVVLVVARRRE